MAVRKKASKKKASPKKATRKKASRKKAGRKKKAARKPAKSLLGDDLPKSLKQFGQQVRRDLNTLERHIENSTRSTRRSLTRIMRDSSHQLGSLEARGQKEWKSMSKNMRKDTDKLMKRVQRAAKRK